MRAPPTTELTKIFSHVLAGAVIGLVGIFNMHLRDPYEEDPAAEMYGGIYKIDMSPLGLATTLIIPILCGTVGLAYLQYQGIRNLRLALIPRVFSLLQPQPHYHARQQLICLPCEPPTFVCSGAQSARSGANARRRAPWRRLRCA